jgi:hypothetical protein
VRINNPDLNQFNLDDEGDSDDTDYSADVNTLYSEEGYDDGSEEE